MVGAHARMCTNTHTNTRRGSGATRSCGNCAPHPGALLTHQACHVVAQRRAARDGDDLHRRHEKAAELLEHCRLRGGSVAARRWREASDATRNRGRATRSAAQHHSPSAARARAWAPKPGPESRAWSCRTFRAAECKKSLRGAGRVARARAWQARPRRAAREIRGRSRSSPRGACRRHHAPVLPVPFLARASSERPASASGMASSWIGLGRSNPLSKMPLSSSRLRK